MRSEYIEVRRKIIESHKTGKNQIDLSFFYNYFIQESSISLNPRAFQLIFMQGDFDEVIKFLDKKFEVNILLDKDGNEIKIVE